MPALKNNSITPETDTARVSEQAPKSRNASAHRRCLNGRTWDRTREKSQLRVEVGV